MQERQSNSVLLVLTAVVGLLWIYPWLSSHRLFARSVPPATIIEVTNPADRGPGTLRDAIFRALRAQEPSSILIRADEIDLQTPLPPLVVGQSIEIRSQNERGVIRAPGVGDVPVFDIRDGTVRIENVEIRNAATYGVRISGGDRVSLVALAVNGSDVAVGATGDYDLEIQNADLNSNRIGVELIGSGRASISQSSFVDQQEAAVWSIGRAGPFRPAPRLNVSGNRIANGQYGLVLANTNSDLGDNEVTGFLDDGVLMLGGISHVEGNRIWNGRGAALRSVGLDNATVLSNDIHENSAIGILMQSASSARIEDNQVYRNGYGIVSLRNAHVGAVTLSGNVVVAQDLDGLVVIGDSPVVAENVARNNGAAGLKIFHLALPSEYIESSPLLDANVLSGNGVDTPVFSEYRVR